MQRKKNNDEGVFDSPIEPNIYEGSTDDINTIDRTGQSIEENSTNQHIQNINAFINIINRIKKISWHGLIDSLLKIIFVVIIILFIKFLINPRPALEYYIDIMEKIQTEQHDELVTKRINNAPLINSYLDMMRIESGMDRAFIMEFHNGNSNNAELPFLWADMTYETVNNTQEHLKDAWTNVSVTRYPFMTYQISKGYYVGSTVEVKAVDNKFACRMTEDCMIFVGTIPLYNNEGSILGILGITSCERDDFNYEIIRSILYKYSTKINPLLLGK